MRAKAVTALLFLAIAGCSNDDTLSIPPPDGRPQGSLLVLETRACNWLLPPDENRCDPVGLVRIGLDGELLEDLTPVDVDGIWVLEVETGQGKLVAPGPLSLPSWSPDGGHLAAFDDEQSKLVIMGRDGSGLTTLDHDPRQFVAPRWLP